MNLASNIADTLLGRNPVSTGSPQPLQSTTKFMHAITWQAKHDVKYEIVPQPLLTHPNDAIIRVTAQSICGSDLHPYNGDMQGFRSGTILGHEFMGLVEEVGENCLLPLGARVIVSCVIVCGQCEFCKAGKVFACETTNASKVNEKLYGQPSPGLFGLGHLLGDYPGGMAEFVRVPHADYNCLMIPPSVRDDQALYITDVLPTSLHGCRNIQEGDTVAIWGMGPIGLMCAKWAQLKGAKRIIGISGTEYRLAHARKTMGIETINYHNTDVVDELYKMEPKGVDVAIDCTGFRFAKNLSHRIQRAVGLESDTPETIYECVKALKKYGTLNVIASYTGFANAFPIGFFFIKELTLTSGGVPVQTLWRECLARIEDGSIDPRMIVTHYMKLSEAAVGYKEMNDHEDGMIKSFIRPDYIANAERGHENGRAILDLPPGISNMA
ncbi:hypothetical protein RvY_16777 [Ramazzottius varieornatus]|uniref:Enoyl reductase (ER) domain-containing protein n=1 Tax=Ramazzottius varieornatus TaxID=947166 RepID=A0A1D1VZR2_RAMVA|nr:hypothetical protein RvY_16777 [Ramazzottius varieornatus]